MATLAVRQDFPYHSGGGCNSQDTGYMNEFFTGKHDVIDGPSDEERKRIEELHKDLTDKREEAEEILLTDSDMNKGKGYPGSYLDKQETDINAILKKTEIV